MCVMEVFLGLVLLGGVGYSLYRVGRLAALGVARVAGARSNPQHRATDAQRLARKRREATARRLWLNALGRDLQLALIHLDQAPDFRRAAAFAARAKAAPLSFRQRQFRRFRTSLLSHLTTRLRAGGDAEALAESLTQLLGHLGIAPFEADYLRQEAERQLTRSAAPAQQGYEQQLRTLQRDHDGRLAALRGLTSLDQELRDQLIEAENERFRESLLQLGDPGNPPTVTG